MAQIGSFIPDESGVYTGTIRTLTLNVKATLRPAQKDHDKASDHRVQAGGRDRRGLAQGGARDRRRIYVDEARRPVAAGADLRDARAGRQGRAQADLVALSEAAAASGDAAAVTVRRGCRFRLPSFSTLCQAPPSRHLSQPGRPMCRQIRRAARPWTTTFSGHSAPGAAVVAFGQKRALVVWQLIVLPDGSSFRIDNVPATDPSGYAGLEDKVDMRTWQLIKGVALSTLLGVGSELAFTGDGDLIQALRRSRRTTCRGRVTGSRCATSTSSRRLPSDPALRCGWSCTRILCSRRWRGGQ